MLFGVLNQEYKELKVLSPVINNDPPQTEGEHQLFL